MGRPGETALFCVARRAAFPCGGGGGCGKPHSGFNLRLCQIAKLPSICAKQFERFTAAYGPRNPGLGQRTERKPPRVAPFERANKMTRYMWAMRARGDGYRDRVMARSARRLGILGHLAATPVLRRLRVIAFRPTECQGPGA